MSQLSNPTGGATIANGNAVVTIVQPTWPQLTIGNTSAIEGDPTAHYRGAVASGITRQPVQPRHHRTGRQPLHGRWGRVQATTRSSATTGPRARSWASLRRGPINGVRTIVFRGGYMYVASEYTNQVLQYNATTGAYVGVFVAPAAAASVAPTA